jgi:hypothetical protein
MKAWVKGSCQFSASSVSARAEAIGAGLDDGLRKYTEGEELYLGHSVYYPSDFPTTQKGFCINMQLHTSQRGSAGKSPALSLSCRDSDSDNVVIRAQSSPGCSWKKPMERGAWHHFVWRIKFSATNGSWDLWYRRNDQSGYTKVVAGCAHNALLSPTDYSYWKLGIYRSVQNTEPLTVYHDLARVGTSFDSVQR